MREMAHRRFAVAVVATLDDAVQAARHLIGNKLEPRSISVVGRQAGFAADRQKSSELGAFTNGRPRTIDFGSEPERIVSLACEPIAPKPIAENAQAFEELLLRGVIPPHARRLAQSVADGKFLLLVKLRGLDDERVATKTLLRSCRGSVEVHDFAMADDGENPSPARLA